MPGVKFYLNNSIEPIIIGSTGIYELNVENLTEITALSFDTTSINMINETPSTSYIIVDILYED
jgi:predicted  nucleic acid-binding Zn-ribbon protein